MRLPWATLSPPSRIRTALLVALALCAIQLALTFPGELVTDSREQLRQAISHQYLDWHPPVMALVWSWLLRINGNPGLLLVLHQSLHWLGFGLIAGGLIRVGLPGKAWLVLAAGAFPVFLYYDTTIVKDVGMGAALIAAFGMIFWFLVQRKTMPWWVVVLSAVCILYGTLIRTNAVFALGPILCLYFARGRQFGFIKIVAYSIITALVALPSSNWINHEVIGAKPQDPLRSLQIFDLMGIAVHSGDYAVLGDKSPAKGKIAGCYTSYWWDTYSPWGICADISQQIPYISDNLYTVTPYLAERNALWRRAILDHPVAYMAHRLSYFNSSIYLFVPSVPFRYSKSPDLGEGGGRVITQRDIYLDYLKKNFLFWPVLWLSLGACALLLLPRPEAARPLIACAQALIISGLLYGGGYLFVGVATDTRYYYWSIMAIMLGIILASAEIIEQLRDRPWRRRFAVTLVVATLLIGYVARIADVRLL